MTRPVPLLLIGLAIALPLSLLAGRVWIDPLGEQTRNAAVILIELRLPRALLAIFVGAGLGGAGAAMQGYLRNPLADPGLFGIAPGAALGAVLSMWLGYAVGAYALPLFALVGAAGAMALLALIAGRDPKIESTPSKGPLILTDASFAAAIRSETPTLVDFWAAWCGPCRMIAPVIERLADQMGDRATIAKLNVDENPRTAQQFNVRSIPMLLIFKNGQVVDQLVGAQPEPVIRQRLEAALRG